MQESQHYNTVWGNQRVLDITRHSPKTLGGRCHVKLGWWLLQWLTFGDSQTHHRVLAYFPGNRHTLMWGEMTFTRFFCLFESTNTGLHAMMVSPAGRINHLKTTHRLLNNANESENQSLVAEAQMVNNSLLWQVQIGFLLLRCVNQPFHTNNILCHDHCCGRYKPSNGFVDLLKSVRFNIYIYTFI